MDYEASTKCFGNAAQRNAFTRQALAAFEEAQGHAELISLWQSFEGRLQPLADSAYESDQLAYELIQARYKAFHERIDEHRARERSTFGCCFCSQD